MPEASQDKWAQWLLHRRHGGNSEQARRQITELHRFRDTVLAHADVKTGETLLDIGTGDGLIGLAALPLVGESGHVIFSDVSQDLLDRVRALAAERGGESRCEFLLAPADNLSALSDSSVDVVTTRSVLIYVSEKEQAFREFYRVLRPGGRISLFEPINRFGRPESKDRFWGYPIAPVLDIAQKIRALYQEIQPFDTDPMTNFDERDLLRFVQSAGFGEIHLELHADVQPATPERWEIWARRAGNPRIPTLEEAMHSVLSSNEQQRFVAHLKPLVEAGDGTFQLATAYLWAVKNG